MKPRSLLSFSLLTLAIGLAAIGTGTGLSDAQAGEKRPASATTRLELLGSRLFHDTRLSEPAGQSCASCHVASYGFTDPDKSSPTSKGADPTLFGNRNVPTAAYAAFIPPFDYDIENGGFIGGLFLDGRAATLEEQAKGPPLNPLEMGNTSKQQVVDKVRAGDYAQLFRSVFGENAFDDTDKAYDRVAQAIAAFERTRSFQTFTSKYDAWLAGRASLTAQELRGMDLYERPDKANCAFCHPNRPDESGRPPMFSDFRYDNLGVPRNPRNRFYTMPQKFNSQGKDFVDNGLGDAIDNFHEDGKFRTQTLRNIALTAPYMHNGYFNTLRGVVEFYNSRDTRPACAQELVTEDEALQRGCWPRPEQPRNLNGDELGRLGLSNQDIDDIVAFLRTLTDGWRKP